MVNDHLLLIVLCVAVSVGVVGVMGFTRTFGMCALRRIPFLPLPRAPLYFIRWLTPAQTDALRAGGIEYIPHRFGTIDGVAVKGGELRSAVRALNARLISDFETDAENVREVVLSFPKAAQAANLATLPVEVYGKLDISGFSFLRRWIARRRLRALVRDAFVPLVGKHVNVHLRPGRNSEQHTDGGFNIYAWSSPSGSWRQRPPERLFGVPVDRREQGFGLSGTGIPIFDNGSEYPVAELVGTDHLYLHFNALATACDTELALLARIADALREEMDVDKFLAEIVGKLPEDGLAIGAEAAKGFNIYDQGFSGRRRDVVKSLVKDVLIPAVRADVFVKQCSGTNQEPLEDGMFHVFFGSAPLGRPAIPTPERLWGYRLLRQEQSFLPSGRGTPICDETGFQIAELVGTNLYLYADLVHFGNSKGAALFAKLLMEVRRELASAAGSGRAAQSDAQFADEIWRQVTTAGKGDSAAARKSGNELTILLKETRAAEQEFYKLEGMPNEAIGREFDELCKIAKVVDITMNEYTLVVQTDVLYCADPRDGVVHEIGAFKISIPTRGGSTITWQNLTRTGAGPDGKRMMGPHIDPNGHACLGNTKDLFPSLISNREFASAVELAIAFVESVNIGDAWGKYIVNWPTAVR